jgi:SAM-dependent methyltransferase
MTARSEPPPPLPDTEEVACYFCGGSRATVWGREAGYRALKCTNCGLVYVSPRPARASIDEAARTGEHATDMGALTTTGRYWRSRVRARERVIKAMFADRLDHEHLRWLDVGAGFGELVEAVTRAFPTPDVVGLEPNRAKRSAALKRGVSLEDRQLADFGSRRFDVVSLLNVWSHLPDPAEFLREVRPLLADSGRLFVETGNGAELPTADAYPDALLLPDHLSFAGERHVVGILERTGFRVEAVKRRRADTPAFALIRLARLMLGKPSRVVIPYRSTFRMIYVRARVV